MPSTTRGYPYALLSTAADITAAGASPKALADFLETNGAQWGIGPIASRPGANATNVGRFYFANDADMSVLFVSDGSVWVPLSDPPVPFAALPTGSKRWDGQRIKYEADAANGVVWEFEFQSGATGSFKWRFVGGAALGSEVDTPQVLASSAYGDLSTVGPSVTVPLAGDYELMYGADLGGQPSTAAQTAFMSPNIGGVAAADVDAAVFHAAFVAPDDSSHASVSRRRRKTGLAAATAIVMKYRSDGSTVRAGNRFLSARPIRVG